MNRLGFLKALLALPFLPAAWVAAQGVEEPARIGVWVGNPVIYRRNWPGKPDIGYQCYDCGKTGTNDEWWPWRVRFRRSGREQLKRDDPCKEPRDLLCPKCAEVAFGEPTTAFTRVGGVLKNGPQPRGDIPRVDVMPLLKKAKGGPTPS